jgi:hypothetical protein
MVGINVSELPGTQCFFFLMGENSPLIEMKPQVGFFMGFLIANFFVKNPEKLSDLYITLQ